MSPSNSFICLRKINLQNLIISKPSHTMKMEEMERENMRYSISTQLNTSIYIINLECH